MPDIKVGAKASLSTINHRQKRRPEDHDALTDRWEATFGTRDKEPESKHETESDPKGDDA